MRVGDQLGHRLRELRPVDLGAAQVARHLGDDLDRAALGRGARDRDRVLDQLVHRVLGAREHQALAVDLRHHGGVVGEARQAHQALVDRAQGRALVRRDRAQLLVDEQLVVAADDADRRAQLVRGQVDELALEAATSSRLRT
jgi:hypothetical protein